MSFGQNLPSIVPFANADPSAARSNCWARLFCSGAAPRSKVKHSVVNTDFMCWLFVDWILNIGPSALIS